MRRLLVALLLLSACAAPYAVEQYERDSGFAGEGAFERLVVFSVDGEEVTVQEGDAVPLTAEEIEARVERQLWSDPLQVRDMECRWHEIVPIEATILCRRDGDIVFYHHITVKGNHQRVDLVWLRDGQEPLTHPVCEGERGFLCPLFAYQDAETCQSLGDPADYCLRIVEKVAS